jgi:hypothetical protein
VSEDSNGWQRVCEYFAAVLAVTQSNLSEALTDRGIGMEQLVDADFIRDVLHENILSD